MAAALPVNEGFSRLTDLPVSAVQVLGGVALGYCIVFRRISFLRIASHPVFLSSYFFIFVISFMEFTHPYPAFGFIGFILRMLVIAMALATLLRDRRALKAFAAGVLVAGFLFAVSMLSQYGFLRSIDAAGFDQASVARAKVNREMLIFENLNAIGFWLLQAALVALVLGTRVRGRLVRSFFLAAAAVFLVASFLPMSRSAVLIVVVTISYYLLRFHHLSFRAVLIGALLGLAVVAAVPPVVFNRMKFDIFSPELKSEGRSKVYRAVVYEFPQYALRGVGEGNFWASWGRHSLFAKNSGRAIGPHSGPAAVLIFWGLPGFFALVLVLLGIFRRVRELGQSTEEMLVSVFAVSGLGLFMVVHNFYNKEFSFLMALPVAAHFWGVGRASRMERRWASVFHRTASGLGGVTPE